jgi:hypothetical protein
MSATTNLQSGSVTTSIPMPTKPSGSPPSRCPRQEMVPQARKQTRATHLTRGLHRRVTPAPNPIQSNVRMASERADRAASDFVCWAARRLQIAVVKLCASIQAIPRPKPYSFNIFSLHLPICSSNNVSAKRCDSLGTKKPQLTHAIEIARIEMISF